MSILPKITNSGALQVGSAAQTGPPFEPQPQKACGATAGTVPATAGVEATTTGPQPITPDEAQGTLVLASGTSASAEVPVSSQALAFQPSLAPLPTADALNFLGVKPDINKMTLDEKFDCLKQCFAYGYGIRKVLCELFESIRAEFKTYKKDRAGIPTVEEAFKQRGLCYKTVYSVVQREKERRAEDAHFFAEIKAKASTNRIDGLDIAESDLPPVGTKIILADGTKGQVLAISEKTAPGSEPSFEVVKEDGTATRIKRDDFITRAEEQAAKAASKAAEGHDPEAERKKAAHTASPAKKDDTAKSDTFYASQYFNLIAMIKSAPKEFTAAEFAQSMTEHLQVAYDALGEDAKRVKPAPCLFPAVSQGHEIKLFKFLSSEAVGRKSLILTVFGGIDKSLFRNKIEKFAQRICDKFYRGEYVVTVLDQTQATRHKTETKTTVTAPSAPTTLQSPATKVGDKSEPTAHGFFYEFRVHPNTPYIVRDMNNPNLAFLSECKNKVDAEFKVMTYEKDATAATRSD